MFLIFTFMTLSGVLVSLPSWVDILKNSNYLIPENFNLLSCKGVKKIMETLKSKSQSSSPIITQIPMKLNENMCNINLFKL